jgi:hypothetical protein
VLNRSDVVVPDGISPLIGYREWDVLDELGSPRLLSLFRPTEWPYERPLRAQCLRHDRWEWWLRESAHRVPGESCACGVYAHLEPEFEPAKGITERRVSGIVLGWGRYVLGTSGWRAEYARISALVRPEDPALRLDVYRAAERYDVPILNRLDARLAA